MLFGDWSGGVCSVLGLGEWVGILASEPWDCKYVQYLSCFLQVSTNQSQVLMSAGQTLYWLSYFFNHDNQNIEILCLSAVRDFWLSFLCIESYHLHIRGLWCLPFLIWILFTSSTCFIALDMISITMLYRKGRVGVLVLFLILVEMLCISLYLGCWRWALCVLLL